MNEVIFEADRVINNNERTWGMMVHLSALIELIFPTFGLIIGPLIIWLIKKKTMPFVKDQGREALNFNISVTIYSFAILLLPIFKAFLVVLFLFWIINIIKAANAANHGIRFRYPLTIRFLAH